MMGRNIPASAEESFYDREYQNICVYRNQNYSWDLGAGDSKYPKIESVKTTFI